MISFDRHKNFLALDFDGVVADSIAECLVVGRNAFVRYSGSGRPVRSLAEFPPGQAAEARRLRDFIRSGEDYVFIFLALSGDAEIRTQDGFDAFKASRSDLKEKFFRLFYEVRTQLSAGNPEAWAALNPLFPGMKDYLASYAPKDRLFIVTTKKTGFVQRILDYNRIAFDPGNLFHADEEHPKRTILETLAKARDADPSCFFLIDDQVDTLLRARPAGVRCLLADWGYNNPAQKAHAREAEIPVITLADFLRRF
ncbi:MAG TPA: HAD family hydrolase [bacterium]|nr:HAD family hydrolase [bacterium]